MRNHLLILVLATSLAPLANVWAAPADQPETGQTTCYDPTGNTTDAIDCAGTGQDGEHLAGMAWPTPRFVVGTGAEADCVTDKLTGLMWVRVPSDTFVIWSAALTSANGLTLCGFADWRLPNINEIESLVNIGAADPGAFLNTQGFSGIRSSYYWSSSSTTGSAANAWIVHMGNGQVLDVAKSFGFYVWPVRAGQ